MKKKLKKQNFTPHFIIFAITALFCLILFTALTQDKLISSVLNADTIAAATDGAPINKKAFLLVHDPIMPNGQKLTVSQNWQNPYTMSEQTVNFFKQTTAGKINYTIVETKEIAAFPIKSDGFTYTPEQYASLMSGQIPAHDPDGVDYYAILSDPTLDICGKLNRGEIDELWMFGGPYFGYNESALAASANSPKGFNYNGPVLDQSSCNKLMPVMGFNYERGLPEMIHNWGHRAEATMANVYRGWEQNRTSHNWDIFGLVDEQSANYEYSGCGSVHWPPNATSDYDYANSRTANSSCDDFYNYPNLSPMSTVLKPVTCSNWGCSQEGYLSWWFKHIPHFAGTTPDGVLSDWWVYIMDPNMAAIAETTGIFNSPTASLRPDNATFSFQYTGSTAGYRVDLSTTQDMSSDVYLSFATGGITPIIAINPTQKWDKYTCSRTLYWRVYNSDRTVTSPIQVAMVDCSVATPSPTPTPTPTPSPVPTATPAPLTYTFSAISDTYTNQKTPTTNYGSTQNLFVRNLKGDEQRSFIKIPVTNMPAFARAKLRIYTTSGSSNSPKVYFTQNTWSETAVTWRKQPIMSLYAADAGYAAPNTWVEYNVTQAVRSNGTYSFGLLGEKAISAISFASRESGKPAELVITVR